MTATTIRPTAPAWLGDLTALSDDTLHERIESLGAHIGRCYTVWHWADGWRAATPAELVEREVPRWVQARVDALNEMEARRRG